MMPMSAAELFSALSATPDFALIDYFIQDAFKHSSALSSFIRQALNTAVYCRVFHLNFFMNVASHLTLFYWY